MISVVDLAAGMFFVIHLLLSQRLAVPRVNGEIRPAKCLANSAEWPNSWPAAWAGGASIGIGRAPEFRAGGCALD